MPVIEMVLSLQRGDKTFSFLTIDIINSVWYNVCIG